MNDDDLLDVLERIAARLDRIEQTGEGVDRIAALTVQLDRIEAEQARINAALVAVAETAMLTYRATGTKTGLPDEVIDAPVMEMAIMRAPLTMPVRRDAAKDAEHLAAIIGRGAAAIDAELRALKQQAQGAESLAERIRLGHRILYLDRAMKQSFEKYEREQGRDLGR